MKKKKKQQIMQKKPKELEELISKKRTEISEAELKFSEEKNKNLVKTLKYELALMLTVKREQDIIEDLQAGGDSA